MRGDRTSVRRARIEGRACGVHLNGAHFPRARARRSRAPRCTSRATPLAPSMATMVPPINRSPPQGHDSGWGRTMELGRSGRTIDHVAAAAALVRPAARAGAASFSYGVIANRSPNLQHFRGERWSKAWSLTHGRIGGDARRRHLRHGGRSASPTPDRNSTDMVATGDSVLRFSASNNLGVGASLPNSGLITGLDIVTARRDF
jgi:hypothetical protein